MMKSSFFAIILLVLLLVACSPEAESVEPPAVDRAATTAPALATVAPSSPVAPTDTNRPTATPAEEQEMNESDATAETSRPAGEVITPVEVNLSELTPEPTVITTPRVLPAPGRPPGRHEAIIQEATQDLAQRLGIDVSEISLVSVEELDWPDGGLGCPEPGMGYITVITPGLKIILAAGGQEYPYHTNAAGNIMVLCGDDGAPVP